MKVRTGSLSENILVAIEKSTDGYVRVMDFIYNPGRYVYGDPSYIKRSQLSQAIKRLRQKGLIAQDNSEIEIIIKLTELGKDALGVDNLIQNQWDGYWRIVIFDIPEQKRIVRDLLRRRLKIWGFRIWQQSVWISKRDVTKKLKRLIRDLKIDQWVVVIESNEAAFSNIMFNGRGS